MFIKTSVLVFRLSNGLDIEQQFTKRNTIYKFTNYILGIKLPGKNGSSRNSEASSAASSINGGKRKARAAATQVAKKMKKGWEVLESDSEDSDKVRIGIWLNLNKPIWVSFSLEVCRGTIGIYHTGLWGLPEAL